MLSRPKLIMFGSLLTILANFTVQADVVVIVHPSNNADLNKSKIKRLFLGKEKKFSNGNAAEPINLAAGATREDFDNGVIGRSSSQVSAYWSKLLFTGKGVPPKEVGDDAAAVAEVAGNPNAIAYVDSGSVTGDVKTVSL